MIIYFSLDEESKEGLERTPRIEELFSELVRASLRRNHFIILNRKACEWAIENLDLSGQTKAQLNYLKSKYTERKALIGQSPCSLEVLIGNSRPRRKINENHKYEIGHLQLIEGNFLEAPRLLVEHASNDGEFLTTVFSSAQHSCQIKSFNVEYCHAGGGSSIEVEFERLKNQKRVVTTFFDSDRHTPICGPSQTLRRVLAVVEAENTIGIAKETVGKEVENYLPLTIIKDSRIRPEYRQFEILESIIAEDNTKPPSNRCWQYFDLKCGLTSDSIRRRELNDEKIAWINERLLADTANLSGFGENILSSFLNSPRCLSDFRSLIKTQEWKRCFSEVFLDIYWYLVAERKRPTRQG